MSSKQNSKNPFIAKDFNEVSNKDIVLHSQSKPNKNSQIFNPFINNTNQNQIKNSVNKNDAKENKSQLLFNTTNKNPFLDRINSNDKSNGIIRIQVFKSHLKPHLSMNPAQTEKSEKLKLSKQKAVVKEEQSDNTPLNLNQINAEKIQYTLVGGETGEYGRKVVLNADTDLPATKYLYKIPSGTYKVTTTFEKMSEFYTVKDNTVNTGTPEYPEELSYVGGPYDLTAGTDDFNGRASKEVTLTLAEDESVLINGTETLIFVLEE